MSDKSLEKAQDASRISIYYDGECPVCSAYVKHVRIRENFGQLELVDARKFPSDAARFRDKGMSLDDGMVVQIDGADYYANDAVNVIALLSSSNGVFNRVNSLIFKNAAVSKALYPLMKVCRAMLLKLLGRERIDRSIGSA